MFSIFLLQFKADISRRGFFFCLSVATVTTLTSTGTDLNKSGHRPPFQKKIRNAAFFFGSGFGFFHSVSFYIGNPDAHHKKKALRVSTRTLTCVPQKAVLFFLWWRRWEGSVWLGKMPKEAPIAGICEKAAKYGLFSCQTHVKVGRKNYILTCCLRVTSFAFFVLFWRKKRNYWTKNIHQ